MAKSQTIKFDDTLDKAIEEYRKKQPKIPPYAVAVRDILWRGLNA